MFGGGRPGSGDGDWICPTEGCGNINFARRMECNRCFTKRTDIPKKQFGDKKTGLFGPGDWACGKCGNMNWERRNECNICKAPKSSLGPDEKRDGAGGGFNERQERVASARREVADDGYDDFGQRRQKANYSAIYGTDASHSDGERSPSPKRNNSSERRRSPRRSPDRRRSRSPGRRKSRSRERHDRPSRRSRSRSRDRRR
ncbi:hypothetical protein Ae201684P_007036 [Aphanomyces euteiches]|nr:hypothetical protein Ae201684P_007036 [Aphanomyces euteiches]